MKKETLLGVAVLGVLGFAIWQYNKSQKKNFTTYSDPNISGVPIYIIN
jgi:DNA-directed RNA polymerase specialized sigma subunit